MSLRSLLEGAGYALLHRKDTWTEILAVRGTERWLGRGLSEPDALDDLARQMFPSAAARALLDAHLAAPAASPVSTALSLVSVLHPSSPSALPAAAAAATPPDVEAALAAAPPSPAPPPSTTPATPSAAAPTPPAAATAAAAPASSAAAALTGRTVDTVRKLAVVELRAVDAILDEIESGIDDLGAFAPEHQRLELLHWMARARACVERSVSGEVNRATAKVAKRLGELAKIFWPGSVRALQLAAMPGDVVPSNARRQHDPRTWAEAAEVVELLRQDRRDADTRLGRDEWGWGDVAKLRPRPKETEAVMADVDRLLEELRTGGDEVDLHVAERAAARLRWIRGLVPGRRWGEAAGSLRRGSQPLGTEAGRLRDYLDPAFTPTRPWAEIVGLLDNPGAAAASASGKSLKAIETEEPPAPAKPVIDVEALKASAPKQGAERDDVIKWLEQGALAADAETLAQLAEHLLPQLDDIAELNLLNDRASRRRVRNVVRRLRGEDELDENARDANGGASDGDGGDDDDDVSRRELDELVARIRDLTHGKSALFISNRDDPELAKRLTSMLGLQLSWAEATPRRIDAVVERIERGGFDYVLSATGFQDHSVDAAIAKAAKSGAVPLVRVNRGRPLACVLALARTLGVRASA